MLRPAKRLREAVALCYAERECDENTVYRVKFEVTRWERYTDNPPIDEISEKTFKAYREACTSAGYAPRTIETGISAFVAALRHVGLDITGGKPLKWFPNPDVATMDELSQAFAYADEWGRALLSTIYFTGLRTADLTLLHRSMFGEDRITIQADKTSKIQVFPIHSIHAKWMRPVLDREYPVRKSPKRLRDSIRRYCEAAGVRYITPKMIRRLAANQYEVSHPGSSGYLLGHSLSNRNPTAYYLEVFTILKRAQERLRIPDAMLPKGERWKRKAQETELVTAFRGLPDDERRTILRLISRAG